MEKDVGKRSPLKSKPLRLPGESVAEERERILDDKVLPSVLAIGFAVGVTLLEWWRWLTKTSLHPVLLTVLCAIVVVVAGTRLTKVRRQLKSLELGLEGERVVGQFLESHRAADWHVFHDIPGAGFNVDHVIVSPGGVFAVETKTFSKPARGNATVKYDGNAVLVDGHRPDRDPVAQARAARDWIRDLLFDATAINFPVRGVVLFPGWYVESPKTGPRPDVWVLNEKAFVKFMENEPAIIKPEDVALAASRLAIHVTR